MPLTDEVISAHLTRENPAVCGLYVTLADSTCRLLACDFDGGTWRLDAAAYAEAAAWAGVPAAVEISRSGDGAHVCGFTNPVIGEIPLFPGTEMAAPTPARPSKPDAVPAAEVRAWAKDNGLDVPARGRLRPEIWDQYRVAHPT